MFRIDFDVIEFDKIDFNKIDLYKNELNIKITFKFNLYNRINYQAKQFYF